jgi:hypothetical protein
VPSLSNLYRPGKLIDHYLIERSLSHGPARRYPDSTAPLYDLQHLNALAPQPYTPNAPNYLSASWQIIRVVLIILLICVIILTIGYLAQLAHNH